MFSSRLRRWIPIRARHCLAPSRPKSEATHKERRRSIGNTDDLVCCLPIEFEVELSPCLAVIPIGEMLELAAPHRPAREGRSFDRDAHARRLACHAALLRTGLGVNDDATCNETLAALVLTREDEDRITYG